MFSHSTNTASFFSVLTAALIFSLSLAGVESDLVGLSRRRIQFNPAIKCRNHQQSDRPLDQFTRAI